MFGLIISGSVCGLVLGLVQFLVSSLLLLNSVFLVLCLVQQSVEGKFDFVWFSIRCTAVASIQGCMEFSLDHCWVRVQPCSALSSALGSVLFICV